MTSRSVRHKSNTSDRGAETRQSRPPLDQNLERNDSTQHSQSRGYSDRGAKREPLSDKVEILATGEFVVACGHSQSQQINAKTPTVLSSSIAQLRCTEMGQPIPPLLLPFSNSFMQLMPVSHLSTSSTMPRQPEKRSCSPHVRGLPLPTSVSCCCRSLPNP